MKDEVYATHSVLDHGYVRLVDHMGDDDAIVRAARVSYANDRAIRSETDNIKLINYLWKNKHTSPFEAVTFTFEIKAPIFVVRQWHRHRTWSYNEVSARYTELPEEYYVPELSQITTQHESNKQMRTEEQNTHAVKVRKALRYTHIGSFELYRTLLRDGVPRELARTVLPLATYTRMYGTVNLKNLLHFLELRVHEHAQYEIRVYAEALLEVVEHLLPGTFRAFYYNTLGKTDEPT